MRKLKLRFLFLWAIMFFSITVSAADWPATLYMEQTSFSSTGRFQADGTDGVYEFTYSAPSTATTDARYYIFSSTNSLTNAKKGTYKIFSASPIDVGTNIQPENGKSYPLYDVSTKEEATALIAAPKTCAFLPIYYIGVTQKVIVNLNDMTVSFTFEPAEPATTQLSIFDKTISKAISTADVTDGIARYSVKLPAERTIYFGANTPTRSESANYPIWGSSTQVTPQNVAVTTGNTYPLERTTYRKVYTDVTCSFSLPAGNYDIIANLNNGTVEFAEYTGAYLAKPATLYMRSNSFGTSYGSSTGENGVYTFTWDKSGSYSAEPFLAIFSEVTTVTSAATAAWNLGATTEDYNVVPVYGKKYPLVFIDPQKVSSQNVGTFMPLYPQKYSVVADLNEMTVTFNNLMEVDDMSSLNILTDGFKVAGNAKKGADGKYRYSLRGAEGSKIFFSTADSKTMMQKSSALNFGAGDHASPLNQKMEYGQTYSAGPMSYHQLAVKTTGFFELPGKCDIVYDPTTGDVHVSEYTGDYETLPETLYLKINTISSTNYATATGEDGIYTFEYTTQGATTAPRTMLFCDATSSTYVTPMSWVLGGSDDGSIVEPAPGQVTPLYDIDVNEAKASGKGCFIPFYPHTYTITLDLKKRTVKWGDPEPLPSRLNLISNNYDVYGTSGAAEDGVYTIETVTYSSHPLAISEATNYTDLRTTKWIYAASPLTGAKDVDIESGYDGPAFRTTAYHLHYNGNGYWKTPEGRNKIKVTLDTKDNTANWEVTPYPTRPTEVIYLIDRDLESLGYAIGDNTGIFEFEVNLKSSEYVGFSDSKSSQGDNERVFFGTGVPYNASRINPADGTEYPIYVTSPDVIRNNSATFYLPKGIWRIRLNLNDNTVSFTDNSRGGVWYIPEAVTLCDDNLNVLATAEKVEEGVFTFNDVEISNDKELTKVVVRDAAENGTIFGANVTGEIGPTVTNLKTYDLYMPKTVWVVTDGASCFGLTPSTYNITVDFNAKTILFVDPSIPVYPSKMTMVIPGDEPENLASAAETKGVYTFSLDLPEAKTVVFTDAEGTSYGSTTENPTVENGAILPAVVSEEPQTFTIPEGLWTVEFSLADMTVKFTNIPRPVFVSTTLPEGSDFYSYFGTGTEPSAVFTINNEIGSIKGVWVVLGDYEGGVPADNATTALGLRTASYSENNLTVGFKNQHYKIPEGAEPKVHIVISTIIDANGNTLITDPVAGLPAGSLVFEYPFKEFERIAIEGHTDFDETQNIDETATVTLSVNNFDKIKFNDIVFATREVKPTEPAEVESNDSDSDDNQSDESDNEDPGDSGDPEDPEDPGDSGDPEEPTEPAEEYIYNIVAAARWTAGETDADGYTPLTVSVPMAARGMGDIYLYMAGLDIDDGYGDHEFDVLKPLNSTVDPTVEVVTNPAEGSEIPALDQVEVTWSNPLIQSVGNFAPSVSVVNEAVNDETPGEVAKAEFTYTLDDKTLIIKPTTPVVEKGTYLIMFKAGDIVFNDDPKSVNKPFALMYNVEPSAGISQIMITDSDEVEVVNMSGIVVRRGKGISTLDGLKGFYIVNGVKCYLGGSLRN